MIEGKAKNVFFTLFVMLSFTHLEAQNLDVNTLINNVKNNTVKQQEELNKEIPPEKKDDTFNYNADSLFSEKEKEQEPLEKPQIKQTSKQVTPKPQEPKQAQVEEVKPKQKLKKFVYNIPQGATLKEMSAEINIGFVRGKKSILLLPFLITDYKISKFNKRYSVDKKKNPVNIRVKNNQIIFDSTNVGNIDLIVEGGAYPILLHIYFNLKTGGQYVAIMDTLEEERNTKPKQMRANNHAETLIAITDALYNNKKIVGFKEIEGKQLFNIDEYQLQLIKTKSIAGNGYLGEVWKITNKGKSPIKITEEMFYEDGVYSVALLNDIIQPNKTSTFYIIRKFSR